MEILLILNVECVWIQILEHKFRYCEQLFDDQVNSFSSKCIGGIFFSNVNYGVRAGQKEQKFHDFKVMGTV